MLSYGENHYKGNDPLSYTSTHAEENAIRKLPTLPRHKKQKKVDILVIRANKSGTLGTSKPCYHCVIKLYKILPEKGYILNDVYFSDREGNIVFSRLSSMLQEENPHLSTYYRERNYKIK